MSLRRRGGGETLREGQFDAIRAPCVGENVVGKQAHVFGDGLKELRRGAALEGLQFQPFDLAGERLGGHVHVGGESQQGADLEA